MTIGEKILSELKKQDKQQNLLAEYIGVSSASISDWAKSKDVKFQNVVKASEFLNVSLDYLAYGAENTSLSPVEKELLNSFRKLSSNEQQRIIGRCEEMVSSKSAENNADPEIIEIAARSKKGNIPKISTNEF